MLPRQLAQSARYLVRPVAASTRVPLVVAQKRTFYPPKFSDLESLDRRFPDYPSLSEKEDPEMNGGYVNPAAEKRQFRDPHQKWDDPQERRNLNEPVHEDNDLHGMFTPFEYTWASPARAALLFATFAATMLAGIQIVRFTYPDRVAYPKEYADGLVAELGGPSAKRARMEGDEL